jgi:hypothetical protein
MNKSNYRSREKDLCSIISESDTQIREVMQINVSEVIMSFKKVNTQKGNLLNTIEEEEALSQSQSLIRLDNNKMSMIDIGEKS